MRSKFYKELLYDCEKTIEESITKKQREFRQLLFKDFIQRYKLSKGDEKKFLFYCFDSYPSFCILNFRSVNDGNPFFPTVYQVLASKIIMEKERILFSWSRGSGKSLLLATTIPHMMVNPLKYNLLVSNILLFAPTSNQLSPIADEFYRQVNSSPFLVDYFIKESLKMSCEFNNGSMFDTNNLARQMSGDTKKGSHPTVIVIEEYGLVEREIKTNIINKMLASAFTKSMKHKRIAIFTPEDKYDNELENETTFYLERSYDKNSPYGFLHLNCWEAIENGAIKPETMIDAFSPSDMNIKCEYVLKDGICPKYFDEKFYCDEICYRNNAFVKEYLAEFPKYGSNFFTNDMLENAHGYYRLLYDDDEIPSKNNFMSIDFGGYRDPQIVLIGNMRGETLYYIYYKETPPDIEKRTDEIARMQIIKNLYYKFKPIRIYADSSQHNDITSLFLPPMPIPKTSFFTLDEKEEKRGISFNSIQTKNLVFINHQKALIDGKIKIPSNSNEFSSKFFREHLACIDEKSRQSPNLYKFTSKKGERDDLLTACALLSMVFLDRKRRVILWDVY